MGSYGGRRQVPMRRGASLDFSRQEQLLLAWQGPSRGALSQPRAARLADGLAEGISEGISEGIAGHRGALEGHRGASQGIGGQPLFRARLLSHVEACEPPRGTSQLTKQQSYGRCCGREPADRLHASLGPLRLAVRSFASPTSLGLLERSVKAGRAASCLTSCCVVWHGEYSSLVFIVFDIRFCDLLARNSLLVTMTRLAPCPGPGARTGVDAGGVALPSSDGRRPTPLLLS